MTSPAPQTPINSTSGIYQIQNLLNGKVYIGQSKDVKRRKMAHFRALERGTHHNLYLQRSWLKNGSEVFKFDILERCMEENLDEREIYWIKRKKSYLDKDRGYNLTPGGKESGHKATKPPQPTNNKEWLEEIYRRIDRFNIQLKLNKVT